MNRIACIAVACLSSLINVYGDIGSTREQCDALYGKPYAVFTKAQLEEPGWIPKLKLEWAATSVCVYNLTPTCQLAAWFIEAGGKTICNGLYFSSYNPSDNLLGRSLPKSLPKVQWKENREERHSFNELHRKGYSRSDGKAVAAYQERTIDGRKLYELTVFTL